MSKDCPLCKLHTNADEGIRAAKGDPKLAIVGSFLAGFVAHVAEPELHKRMCDFHHRQLLITTIAAIGVQVGKGEELMDEIQKSGVEGATKKALALEPPPRGKDSN